MCVHVHSASAHAPVAHTRADYEAPALPSAELPAEDDEAFKDAPEEERCASTMPAIAEAWVMHGIVGVALVVACGWLTFPKLLLHYYVPACEEPVPLTMACLQPQIK